MNNNINKTLQVGLVALAFSSAYSNAMATCTLPPDCATLGFTKTAGDCSGKTILKCPFNQGQVYCPAAEESEKAYKLGDTYIANGLPIGKIISLNDCGSRGGGGSVTGGLTVAQCIAQSGCTETNNYIEGGICQFFCKAGGALIATGLPSYGSCAYTEVLNKKADSCSLYSNSCSHGTIATTGSRIGTFSEASTSCANMTTGGLTWFLPTNAQLKQINSYVSNFSGFVWDQTGQCGNGGGNQSVIGCEYNGTAPRCNYTAYTCPQSVLNSFTMGYFCVAAF